MPPLSSGLVVLIVTLCVQALVTMSMLTLPVVAPIVADTLGVSPAYLGLYIAIAYVGAMTASLAGGGVVRRFGAIRASQAALMCCAAGLVLSVLQNLAAVVAGAMLLGFGYGPVTPASSHLLARTTPADRMSFVFSIKQTGVPVGGILAGAIVPGLAGWLSWPWAFMAVAVSCVACALAIQPLRATFDGDRDATQRISLQGALGAPVRLVFGHPALKALAFISLMFSVIQLAVMTYLVTYLHEDMGVDLVTAGLLLAVTQTTGAAGRLMWGYVSDRWAGPVKTLALIALLILGCALATPFVGAAPMWPLLVLLVLFGGSAIGWNGVYLAEVARQAPAGKAGVATGGTLALTFSGNVIGPPLFGALAGLLHSYGLAYAALALPAGLSLWLLWRHRSSFA